MAAPPDQAPRRGRSLHLIFRLPLRGGVDGPNPAADLHAVPRTCHLAFRLGLILLGYTTAFGALLVLLGGWYFLRGAIPRGRFCVGLGIGLTSLLLVSRIAYSTLAFGTPLAYLVPLATSLTGLGILFGVAAHTTMGSYALLVKRRAGLAIRRWRRARRARGSRSKGSGSRG
ncbi:MAG: hypothetical protein E6K18_08645 [Methanobacteriota archaeon]|nr:MAG: hypothetical protein E6K18_08645 [Euryarchaeota archaeon]